MMKSICFWLGFGCMILLMHCTAKENLDIIPKEQDVPAKYSNEWYNWLGEQPDEFIIQTLGLPKLQPEIRYKRSIVDSPENSLDSLWGSNYTVHRIDTIENWDVKNSQYFMNMPVLRNILSAYGQDTTSYTDSFRDTLSVTGLMSYLPGWGSFHELGLDTIYKVFWNSHGTICSSPTLSFIDANSTKWDEALGVASQPEPHKSFTIMVPLGVSGSEVVYHLVNNSNPPSRR